MEIQNPSLFELNNVHQVYEIISEHFDKTRYHTWPIIDKFIKSFNKGSLIGDIGCGNGRNCLVRDDCKFIGTDISESLVNICKNKGIDCTVANNLELPFKDNHFDYLMSIAVIHHFCNEERRIKAMRASTRNDHGVSNSDYNPRLNNFVKRPRTGSIRRTQTLLGLMIAFPRIAIDKFDALSELEFGDLDCEKLKNHLFDVLFRESDLDEEEIRQHLYDLGYEKTLRQDMLSVDGGIFPFSMYKKQYMIVGGFDTLYNSPFICDWDFFLKLELNGKKFKRVSEGHFYHFVSMATKKGKDKESMIASENPAAKMFLYKWGIQPHLYQNNSHNPKDGKIIKGIKYE